MIIEAHDLGGCVARPEQDSKLLDLPPEILDCIVKQDVYQKGDRGKLRLVCRALDDSAQYIVLATLALSSLKFSQLKELASSQSGFEDHAKHLRFLGFCEREGDMVVSNTKLEDVICQIVRKMKSVFRVHLTECPPLVHSRPILQAIGMLPLLEGIQVWMMNAGEEELTTATNALSNLKSLRFRCTGAKVPDSSMERHISMLLAKSPQLSKLHLTLGTVESGHKRQKYYSLSSIVTPISTRPNFRPTLRLLDARSLVISPTGPCLAYLGCLTTLCMSTVGQSDSIWPALHTSRIMLDDLTVDAATERLVQYLLGYQGLKAFHANGSRELGWNAGNPLPLPDTQQVVRLFDQALPHHRESLIQVGIWFTEHSWGTQSVEQSWALNAKQLETLGRLSKLERLAVSVWVNENGEGVMISVKDALTSIFTRLSPSLREAQFHSYAFGRSMHDIQYAVADYEFDGRPSNIQACLVARSPWFIRFDEARKVFKFKTTNTGILGRLVGTGRYLST